jgi:hypothetical protein
MLSILYTKVFAINTLQVLRFEYFTNTEGGVGGFSNQ